ncbi:hypothetical protein ACFW0H_25140 [Pseudomonas sp. CR3202]|uniref:hypothetical protein n=1 Tax=Pseudomonas sp. CR3202 TaxID=3351532 RepID=UPI003BF07A76
MEADMDDAPSYIHRRGWQHIARVWTIPAIAGTCVTLGLLQLANFRLFNEKAHGLADRQAAQAVLSGPIIRPQLTPAETGREYSSFVQPAPRAHLWKEEQVQQPSLAPSPKQTVFNDRNYAPRGADNVVSMTQPKDSFVIESAEPKGKGVRVKVVGEKRDFKEAACWPYREGSIEKRNCKAGIGLYMRNEN